MPGLNEVLVPFATLPFGAVVLATEQCHFFVVKEGHSTEGSLVGVVDIAADVFCW